MDLTNGALDVLAIVKCALNPLQSVDGKPSFSNSLRTISLKEKSGTINRHTKKQATTLTSNSCYMVCFCKFCKNDSASKASNALHH